MKAWRDCESVIVFNIQHGPVMKPEQPYRETNNNVAVAVA